ncbi:hypothetical protein ABK040_009259 [Willaertia magna]
MNSFSLLMEDTDISTSDIETQDDQQKEEDELTNKQNNEEENIQLLINEYIGSLQNRQEEIDCFFNTILQNDYRILFKNYNSFKKEEDIEESKLKELFHYNNSNQSNQTIIQQIYNKLLDNHLIKTENTTFIEYTLSTTLLRKILYMLLKEKIIPTMKTMKYAVHCESVYGSFRNAEILLNLLLFFFKENIYSLQNEIEELKKVFSILTRYAPTSKLSVYYHELFIKFCNDHCNLKDLLSECQFACVIFNLVIDLNESENLKETLIWYYYNKAKENNLIGSVTKEIINRFVTQNNSQLIHHNTKYKKPKKEQKVKNLKEENEMEESETLSICTFSSTKTDCIQLNYSTHAKERMNERKILENDIKHCIKWGIKQMSNQQVKCTDEKLIIVYQFKGKRPHIITAYRHLTKLKLEEYLKKKKCKELFFIYCDFLLTSGLYGNFKDCKDKLGEMKSMLLNGHMISNAERNCLQETLKYLVMDCCPTYEDQLEIIEFAILCKIQWN